MIKIVLSKEYLNNHKKEEGLHLANFDIDLFDEELIEERARGTINIKKYGICKIQIYTGEGTIPHFHIENDDKTFLCCIRLDKPEYFNHGVKQNKLNNTQIKELIKILNSKSKNGKFTIYEFMCYDWNSDLDNDYMIKEPFIIPDYSKLNK